MPADTINETIYKAAKEVGDALVEAFPPDHTRLIPAHYLNPITDYLQTFIAEVIQSWIDAGSEREVTMENLELTKAIREELFGWSDDPANLS